MTAIKKLTALLFFLTVGLMSNKAEAQIIKTYLTINNVSIRIENLSILDSVSDGDKLICSANFDISLYNTEDMRKILPALQSGMKNEANMQAILTTIGDAHDIVEERTFNNSFTQQMLLNEFEPNGSSLRISVKIKATSVTIKHDGQFNEPAIPNTTLMRSVYRFQLGDLPTGRITRMSNMNITADNSQLQNSTLTLSIVDGKTWNEFLLKNELRTKKPDGLIELLADYNGEVIGKIKLSEVEILSYSFVTNYSQNSPARAIVRFRAKTISIELVNSLKKKF